jgi:hypothetical protein
MIPYYFVRGPRDEVLFAIEGPAVMKRSALLLSEFKVTINLQAYIHKYIPLTLYPRRGRRGISNIPPRHPRLTKMS